MLKRIELSPNSHLVSADELLNMPLDGFRYELIRGELRQMPLFGMSHGRVCLTLGAHLLKHVKVKGLGEVYATGTGYKLVSDSDTVLAPDVSFVSRRRLADIGETDGYWPAAPDLAIEVISPDDRYLDVLERVGYWLDAGTRMVVVVSPKTRNVAVHRSLTSITQLVEEDYLDGADVVPGWTMPVRDIFS